jgi:hypothetical protein
MHIKMIVYYQLGPSTAYNLDEGAPWTTSSMACAILSMFDWFMPETLMRPLRSM